MRTLNIIAGLFALTAPLLAQSGRVPVVLLNGYQATCSGTSDSSATFGAMQSLLTADGWPVYFFDNCSVLSGATGNARPTIEQLAQAFGTFLESLGAPQVDVVAHSMGGLIVRAWLAGKLPQGGFLPPPVTHIRKAVFIATPHAGILAISGLIGANVADSQTKEMFAGSRFLWDLATWNQRRDDLRGVDALSIAGNLGGSSGSPHSHDGVVALTSASLAATLDRSRVRVLPYCHEANLPSILCSGPGIAYITDRSHATYRIVTSFLLGATDWQNIGSDASQDAVLSRYGGVLLGAYDNLGNPMPEPGAALLLNAPQQGDLPWNSQGVFFADYIPAGQYQVSLNSSIFPLPVPAGGHMPLELKAGPQIALVASAAATLPTLSLAPGMLISIFGSSLQGASVTIGGNAAPIFYDSAGQINTVIPQDAQGLVPVSVVNALGRDTVNVLLTEAVPAVFTADGSGTGAALALHSGDSSLVSDANPAHPGESVAIFLTGLGAPAQIPAVQADGAPVNVLGLTPWDGVSGIFRLDIEVPASSSSSIQLRAEIGAYSSNPVTVSVSP